MICDMRPLSNSVPTLSAIASIVAAIWILTLPAGANPDRWREEGWTQTDFTKTTIEFREILSGGPPKDGIPSIDSPRFAALKEASALAETEPVIGFEINGDARAYPLRILIWHEIANDVVGGVPVSVTYCPLCNSAIVFDRRVGGAVLDFGTTGKLRNSDLVMYDRQTESWWQQFTGTAIVGKYTGTELKVVPARLESFESFKSRHPGGTVLVPEKTDARDYGRNPYAGYDSAAAPFLYDGEMPKGVNPMARVVTFKADGKPHAVTLEVLREKSEMTVGNIRLNWRKGQNSALDTPDITKGRDVGNIVVQRKAANQTVDIAYDVTFAFVFHAFHPDRPILMK